MKKIRIERVGLILALALALLLAVTACGSDSTNDTGEEKKYIKLTEIVGGSLSPFYYQWAIADSLGYWEEDGIIVDFLAVDGGSSAFIQQIEAGDGDVSQPSPTNLFEAAAQGFLKDTKVVGTWLYNQPFQVKVIKGSPITDVTQLKGKTIGVSDISGGEVELLKGTLSYFYKMEADKDYYILPIGDSGAPTLHALNSGEVAAYTTANKDFIGLTASGIEFVDITPPEYAKLPANVIVTKNSLYEEHPEIVAAYLKGLIKAAVFAKENPDKIVAAITIKHPEMTDNREPDFVKKWVQLTQPFIIKEDLLSSKKLMETNVQGLYDYIDYLKMIGALDKEANISLDNLVTNSLIDDANNYDYEEVKNQTLP